MLPEGWKSGKIQDFFLLQRGFDLTKDMTKEGYFPVYSSSGISYYHNEYKVKGPGVITGRKGSLGVTFLSEENFWPHDTTLWVCNCKGNNLVYIKYFLDFIKLERFDEASSVPTLNRNNVHRQECLFPPVVEQDKIVMILSTWDKAISTADALLENCRQQKKALMQQLLTGKRRLPGFKGEWKNFRLLQRAAIAKGTQINKATLSSSGDYPVMNGGILPSGYFDSFNSPANSIIISEGGNSCGFVQYMKTCFWCGGHCYKLEIKYDYDRYIYHYLKFFEKKIMALRVGSGLPNIQKERLANFGIKVPPLDEQRAIAAVLDAADREIALLEQKAARLREEKKALMQQLLTGKRRVRI